MQLMGLATTVIGVVVVVFAFAGGGGGGGGGVQPSGADQSFRCLGDKCLISNRTECVPQFQKGWGAVLNINRKKCDDHFLHSEKGITD